MGIVGDDMAKFMQYQTAQTISKFAEDGAGGGGLVGDTMGLGVGMTLGQVMAQNLSAGLTGHVPPATALVKPEDVLATLEKLGQLKAQGVLTQQEFDTKKTELLKKLA
jgi:membrane protease subunit (stomatin/prohibitin family)